MPAPAASSVQSAEPSPAAALDRWTGDPRFMHSLARGLLALETVAAANGAPISARRLADSTGLSLGAAQRCLYTLNALGYVRADRSGAVAGISLAKLAQDYTAPSAMAALCGPVLDALYDELNVTISLASLDGALPVVIASRRSATLPRLEIPVGATLSSHATAIGKVHLASLADDVLDQLLAFHDFEAYTPHTLTSPAEVKQQALTCRLQGFATADQELMVGISGAAVPVKDSRGTWRAALGTTLFSPTVRMREVRSAIVPALTRAAERLSELFG